MTVNVFVFTHETRLLFVMHLDRSTSKVSGGCVDDPRVKQCTWKKLAARKCPNDKHFQKYCCATCKKIISKYFCIT